MRVLVRHLVDDATTDITFKGARISTQLFARDRADGRGCRAVVVVYDKKGRRVRVWHGACVFSIDKTWGKR